ncbi:methylated-DNA--[protein]-cysteine S-methyltransferase [Companilactobacillus jidongensis]|uniref:methylated-DNA--[protein]-cysteine S-methyltransferase n=1 Tax=Companilactobacillus jidongensis TaxID=2486006 RepID=UPI000F7AB557|nr:methylated-DNA--[protein]-cysteine S-methyltransferase [Companilactobacillus jidongensis]
MKEIYYQIIEFDNHTYIIAVTDKGLAYVGLRDETLSDMSVFYPKANFIESKVRTQKCVNEVKEYLQGERTKFNLKIDISGTEFQESVWKAVAKIPYGSVSNYTKIANEINRPKAVRAVGTAIGKNPVPLVVPCHRVLAKDGTLGGYRGGLAMKSDLLQLERNVQL